MNNAYRSTELRRAQSGCRVLVALAGLTAFAGCHHKDTDTRTHGELFVPESEERDIHRMIEAQVASGTRSDAMLRTAHFDQSDLNSLGESKLDSMLKDDDACNPMVVFLDMPEDELYAGRGDSVRTFLKDHGLLDTQIKLEHGPNKKVLTSAAQAMRAKRLIDSGAPVGINPEPTGSVGALPAK